MSQATTVKEVLIAARWMIENVGWCQNYFYTTNTGEGRFDIDRAMDVSCLCASGAMHLVETTKELREETFVLFMKTIGNGLISEWNDHPQQIRQRVLAAFDRAIKKA